MIGLVGSVFSPYYAHARRRAPGGAADPLHHCALNVALYGTARGSHHWAMTERGRTRVQRGPDTLQIGPSAMRWERDALVIDIDERSAPFGSHLRGTVRLHPAALARHAYALDAEGRHAWQPIAPCARVEARFDAPASLRWTGTGYLDSNRGSRPLEADFVRWDWSRAALGGAGRAAVLYDVQRRTGEPLSLALAFGADGVAAPFDPPPRIALPRTAWRVPRGTRSDDAGATRVQRTLEDTPFYARSLIDTHLLGAPVQAVHESLSLDRFDRAWCQAMLPFRMPRRAGR